LLVLGVKLPKKIGHLAFQVEVFEGFWDTIGRFDSIHPAATPENIYNCIYLDIGFFIYIFI